MVKNLALYAIGGLAATEATGLTNITVIGGKGDDPEDNPITNGFPGYRGVAGALTGFGDAFGQFASQAGATTENMTGLAEAIQAGQGQTASRWADVVAMQNDQIARLTESIPSPDVSGGGGGGGVGGGLGVNTTFGPGGAGTGNFVDNEFQLQDLAGTSRTGTAMAAIGESGVALESFGGDVKEAVGTPGRGGGGFFGGVYQAGRTTGEAIEMGQEAYGNLNERYREATEGPRNAAQTVKDVTRPWRWDVDTPSPGSISPVGTVAGANTEGSTEMSPGPVSEREVGGADRKLREASRKLRAKEVEKDIDPRSDTGIALPEL